MLKVVNVGLLLVALVGIYFAIDAGLATRRLRGEHQALSAAVGLLRITDPDKLHVVALKRDGPLDFAWQMYVPAGFRASWSTGLGQGGSTSSSGGSENDPYFALVRTRFRQNADGHWEVWTKSKNSSSTMSLSPEFGKLLLLRPGQLDIEQAGAGEVLVLEKDEACHMLRIRAADTEDTKPLFEFRFGSGQVLRKSKSQKSK
jgi:hypothetical protein